jgi:hypothetical protein
MPGTNLNAKYKVIELENGIRYGTIKNMPAARQPHFVDGFNGRQFAGRDSGSCNGVAHSMGRALRARYLRGDVAVRQSDGMLVPTIEKRDGNLWVYENAELVPAQPFCPRCQLRPVAPGDYVCQEDREALDAEVATASTFAGRGPDDDGEQFIPMSDEAMAFAQACAEREPLFDPFADEEPTALPLAA